MSITLEIKGLDKLQAGFRIAPQIIQKAGEAGMRDATLIAEAEIKARTPRVTGRLFSAWQGRVTPHPLLGIIGNPVIYAPFVEEGTRPHEISAVRAKALATPYGLFKSVHHPGSKGRHMAREGLAASAPSIQRAFAATMQIALLKIKEGA